MLPNKCHGWSRTSNRRCNMTVKNGSFCHQPTHTQCCVPECKEHQSEPSPVDLNSPAQISLPEIPIVPEIPIQQDYYVMSDILSTIREIVKLAPEESMRLVAGSCLQSSCTGNTSVLVAVLTTHSFLFWKRIWGVCSEENSVLTSGACAIFAAYIQCELIKIHYNVADWSLREYGIYDANRKALEKTSEKFHSFLAGFVHLLKLHTDGFDADSRFGYIGHIEKLQLTLESEVKTVLEKYEDELKQASSLAKRGVQAVFHYVPPETFKTLTEFFSSSEEFFTGSEALRVMQGPLANGTPYGTHLLQYFQVNNTDDTSFRSQLLSSVSDDKDMSHKDFGWTVVFNKLFHPEVIDFALKEFGPVTSAYEEEFLARQAVAYNQSPIRLADSIYVHLILCTLMLFIYMLFPKTKRRGEQELLE